MKSLMGKRGNASASQDGATKTVTVVSGLPRSGTSMMMKMLEAGGLQVLTDEIREPDEDNPRGYYEFERVKALRNGDVAWLVDAQGKVVKIISELLKSLPSEYEYKILFMLRDVDEVLASQRAMLARKGIDADPADDEKLRVLYEKHTREIEAWLAGQPNMKVMYVSYGDLLADPSELIPGIGEFLGDSVAVDRMKGVVDPTLYRQRSR